MNEDQIQEFVQRWEAAERDGSQLESIELRCIRNAERKIGVVFDLLLELARRQD